MPVPPALRPEISDLVVRYDAETLERQPVSRDFVLDRFGSLGMSRAKAIVSTWPHRDGILDAHFVDRVLVHSHLELQRLSEEFQQGARIARLLVPALDALRAAGVPAPYRIVDVGCGLGYVIRWLAHARVLGDDVELLGCDYNTRLIEEAQHLTRLESLRCSFAVANAFQLDAPATLFMSTGVVHHFRDEDLNVFFSKQIECGALGFLHSDIKPTWLAPLGSWIFHTARMRQPLAQHDGILSAQRAHPTKALRQAAQKAGTLPGKSGGFGGVLGPPHRDQTLWVGVFDGRPEVLPLLHVLQTVIGLQQHLAEGFMQRLGALAQRVEVL